MVKGRDGQGDERNVVLALARIWFSVVTGGFAPKDVAAAWALERLPAAWQPVLVCARNAYLGLAPDTLAKQAPQVMAWVRHVKGEILQAASVGGV